MPIRRITTRAGPVPPERRGPGPTEEGWWNRDAADRRAYMRVGQRVGVTKPTVRARKARRKRPTRSR